MSRPQQTVFGVATAGLILVVVAASFVASRAERPRQGPFSYRLATRARLLPTPFLMFQTLGPARAYGRIAMVAPTSPGMRYLTPLRCTRVFYAGGTGLCLAEQADGGTVAHVADVFDRMFTRTHRIALAGVPTRVRVSPDGQWAAVTTYAEEESPAGERLAIESVLIDTRAGRAVADLREFRIDAADTASITGPLDFASVSFAADGDRFYATLSTPTARHVMVGSLRERRLHPIHADRATEALSPDGSRLIVKDRVGDRGFWQLAVLHLATMTEQRLDQGGRSVDDQVEWLDNEHVVYHDATEGGTGLWTLAADGSAGPRLLVPDAFSPVPVR